jgi:hypothetical protein
MVDEFEKKLAHKKLTNMTSPSPHPTKKKKISNYPYMSLLLAK